VVLDGAENIEGGPKCYLPVSLQGFRCYQDRIDKGWVHTRLRTVEKDDTQVIDIEVYDDAERPVAEVEGLSVRLLSLAKLREPQGGSDDLFYRTTWRESVRPDNGFAKARDPASWMIFADAKGIGTALAGKLEAAGHHCHLVFRE